MAFIARYPFRNKERWARNAVLVAFGIWLALDSAICLYSQVYAQVYVINAISLLQEALPLIFTWKHFYGKNR